MDEQRLRAAVATMIRDAEDHMDQEALLPRAEAMRLYLGAPFGNEIEGRSQVVSRDVMDAVEWVMPSLLRIFHGGDQPVVFEPTGPEDEAMAEQATDYIGHVYGRDNPGFLITETWLKDALIGRHGVVKRWWETVERISTEDLAGLSEDEAALIAAEPGVTVLSAAAREEVGATVYDLRIRRQRREGVLRVANLPPGEFLVERGARSIEEAGFVAHRRSMTRAALVEAGFDPALVARLPAEDAGAEEAFAPSGERGAAGEPPVADPSGETVRVYECWLRIDRDGTGRSELRRIRVAGADAQVLLDDEPAPDVPFHGFTPILLPHRMIGLSFADLLQDIQLVKSTLWRQMLDGLYLSTTPVTDVATQAIDPAIGLEDALIRRPGGIRRWRDIGGVRDSTPDWGGAQAFPMLDYLDQQREGRTGAGRTIAGLSPELLATPTATAAMQAMTAAQARIERRFAELALKPLFRGLLRDVVRHQDRARVIRLRGRWVPMDPRSWNAEMDVSVTVGLGTGSREAKLAQMATILSVQREVLAAGGMGGMVTPRHLYATLRMMTRLADLPSADPYFSPPREEPPGPPPPDPALVALEAQIALERRRLGAEIALKRERAAAEIRLDRDRMLAELALRREARGAEAAP